MAENPTAEQLALRREAEQAAFREFAALGRSQTYPNNAVANYTTYYTRVFGQIAEDGKIITDPGSNNQALLDGNLDGVPDLAHSKRLFGADGRMAYEVATRVQEHVNALVNNEAAVPFDRVALEERSKTMLEKQGFWESLAFNPGASENAAANLLKVGTYNFERAVEPVRVTGHAQNEDGSVTITNSDGSTRELSKEDVAAIAARQNAPIIIPSAPVQPSPLTPQTPAGIDDLIEAVNPNPLAQANATPSTLTLPATPTEPTASPAVAEEAESTADTGTIAATEPPVVNSPTANTYTIKPGDSLSAIIAEHYKDDKGIPNNAIGYIMLREAIEKANGLEGNVADTKFNLALAAGTEITLPDAKTVREAMQKGGVSYAVAQAEIKEAYSPGTQIASEQKLASSGIGFA